VRLLSQVRRCQSEPAALPFGSQSQRTRPIAQPVHSANMQARHTHISTSAVLLAAWSAYMRAWPEAKHMEAVFDKPELVLQP
jgi:hypothetical protein